MNIVQISWTLLFLLSSPLISSHIVLTPHLEAMSFDLKKFFSICNSIAVITAALFYLLLADRWGCVCGSVSNYYSWEFTVMPIHRFNYVTINASEFNDEPPGWLAWEWDQWGWYDIKLLTAAEEGPKDGMHLSPRVYAAPLSGGFVPLSAGYGLLSGLEGGCGQLQYETPAACHLIFTEQNAGLVVWPDSYARLLVLAGLLAQKGLVPYQLLWPPMPGDFPYIGSSR